MLKKSDLIVPLSNISNEDKDLVGEKAAKLGEIIKQGFPLPEGFIITPNAYRQFALNNNLPDKLIKEIFRAYKRLESPLKDASVEILLSLPPERKKETAKGEAVLIEKIKSIFVHFLRTKEEPAIIVRKIPQTPNVGTMFTTDPLHNDKTKIVIKEGKTENHYELLRKDLNITSKIINKDKVQILTDKQVVDLALLGKKLQDYYYFPQEVKFAIDENKIFITQTKPLTHISSKFNPSAKLRTRVQSSRLQGEISNRKILLKGNPIYPGIATGHLRIIQNMQDTSQILRGEIIVIPYQDMIKHPVIKAGAIVAIDDRLYHMPHLPHAPFFSGKPTIVTIPNAINVLKNGTVVTVNGKSGEVYAGSN